MTTAREVVIPRAELAGALGGLEFALQAVTLDEPALAAETLREVIQELAKALRPTEVKP